MKREIFNFEQCSPEWFDIRKGCITASEFKTVLAKGKGGKESKQRRTYMLKLAGEILTGQPAESYTNPYMERGKEIEQEARSLYEFITGNTVEQVGFIKWGDVGYSPDGLVDDGLIEIKTKTAHLQLDLLLSNKVPSEHIAQLQGGMWVSDKKWIDFMSYWPGLPPFIKRVERDEIYISRLKEQVEEFSKELSNICEKIRTI